MSTLNYPNGSTDGNPIVLTDDSLQLQVATGSATQSGVISESGGSHALAKIGAGTLIFTADNTYTGTTTISAGTLQLGNGGTTGTITGNVVDNGELDYDRPNTLIYSGSITGTGSLHMIGSGGQIILLGDNNFSGGTVISHGALVVGNQTTTGSITGNIVDGDVTSNVSLVFDRSNNYTFGGNISGLGEVDQYGSGTLTLTGTNTYSERTYISQGILAVAGDSNLGTGPVILGGGALRFLSSATSTLNYQLAGAAFDTNGNNVTLSGIVSTETGVNVAGGYGGLTKLGVGTLTLTGANTVVGPTLISAGTLQIGGGGTSGALGTAAVTDNSVLIFNRSDGITAANTISGSGTLTQAGSGTLTLTGADTYTGLTTISSGTLALSGSGSIAASSSVSDSGTFDISGTSGASITSLSGNGTGSLGSRTLTITNGTGQIPTSAFAGVIQDGGIAGGVGGSLVLAGGGEALTGANTYSGTTTIAAGAALFIGVHTATGSLGSGAVTDNGRLVYQLTAPETVANVISGTGELDQADTGTLTITAADSYTGNTLIYAGTTLVLSGAGSVAASAFVGGYGGTFDISGTAAGASVKALTDSGTGTAVAALGSKTLTISAGASYIFSGVIQDGGIAGGTGGGLALTGGAEYLTGSNTYTGVTTIASGAALVIGDATATGSLGSGTVTDNGLLAYRLTGSATVGNVISGAGGFTQYGTGTTTLSNTNTYSGTTYAAAGKLLVDGSIAASSSVVGTGATLGGAGTVGTTSVLAGGTLAPGDTIGTLHVSGNLTLAAGAIYAEDLSPGSADTTIVSGTASIAGNVTENFAGGSYTIGTTYTLLSSTGALSGKFSNFSATGLPAGLSGLITYDAHDVYLTIEKAQVSDFSGDGRSDLLLQNNDGTIAVWSMDGTTLTGGASVAANGGPSWHVKGTGDFNADGKPDILLQNNDGTIVAWTMNGDTVTSGVGLAANPGPSWHVVGTGDFNSDSKSDIVLQNNDGSIAIWMMNGTTVTSGAGLAVNPGPGWHVKGAGDFNGDGKSDLLLQNDDGTPVIWLMNGTTVTGGAAAGPNPGPSWQVTGTGDFNGDGKADIALQSTDGTPAVWIMNGTSLVAGGGLSNPGTSWHVAAG